MKAMWKGVVLAQSAQTQLVDGAHYFPRSAVGSHYLRPSAMRRTCVWKGTAAFYHLVVDGEVHADAAWYYPEPVGAFRCIKDHVAFFQHVNVVV